MTREEKKAIEMQNIIVFLAPLIADMLTDDEELREEFTASLLQTKVVRMGGCGEEMEASKKIKICAYCKNKGKEQKTDAEGFTYYRWFCELTGDNIEATGTCERYELNW